MKPLPHKLFRVAVTRSVFWVGVVFCATALVGCYESAEDKVKEEATTDLDCPENALHVLFMGTSSSGDLMLYQVQGCGRTASYLCRGDKKAFDTEYYCCNAASCHNP
jgi:hypothetical protein